MKNKIAFIIIWIVTILLIGILLWKANLNRVIETISSLNFQFVLYALIFAFFTLITKVIRWKYIHPDLKEVKLVDGFAYYTIGMYFSLLTLMKAGDAAKVFLLRFRDKIRTSIALMTVIVDRLLELIAIVILCIFGLLVFSKKEGIVTIQTEMLILIMCIGIILLSLLIARFEFMIPFIKKMDPFLQRLAFKFLKNTDNIDFEKVINDFSQSFRDFLSDFKVIFITLFLSVFAWILYTIQFYFIAFSVGLNLKMNNISAFGNIIFVVVVAAIISQLPLTIGGIGSRDLAYIVLLNSLDYNNDTLVITATFCQTIIGIIIPSVIGAFLAPHYIIINLKTEDKVVY